MEKSNTRYLCIHGHFYQPPRENPWLERIELQESAHPFHDWNERINEECYSPNAQARILDEQGRLRLILNNYEHISFDFGPTLLSWMEQNAPHTYHRVLEADASSVSNRSGHGNAIAQAYNHIIMPLASHRDKATQIIWGIEDFATRFKRDPEGMWLPETAVDTETLRLLAEHGIRFTILAPRQAKRFRTEPGGPWADTAPAGIDPSKPYLCRLKGGSSIVLFFYDAPISHSIAFEHLLDNGENFRNRLLGAFSNSRTWPQLVHISTDGESYGHHHKFGEMALAFALEGLMTEPGLCMTNYGQYLAEHPPTAEAEFFEPSSWSCAHGVGRWSDDCGCSVSMRPDWNQKWRRTLRSAMDLLRDRVDKLFVELARPLLKDPWEARNRYIKVLLADRDNVGWFLKVHAREPDDPTRREQILRLMEMQRNRMLMYTSCGWFFDDITGLESIQILRYAARALQLAYPYDPELKKDFLREMSLAHSNIKPPVQGDELFEQRILPQVADLDRVAAHAAIYAVFEDFPREISVHCYDISMIEAAREESGERTLLVGRLHVRTSLTSESKHVIFSVVHLGGVDLRCSVAEFRNEQHYSATKAELIDTFRSMSSTELIRKLDRHFPGRYYSIADLFVDQRRMVVDSLTEKMYEEQAGILTTFYRKNKDLSRMLVSSDAPLPDTFIAAARFVLRRTLLAELEKLARGMYPDELETVLAESRFWKIAPDVESARQLITQRILDLMARLQADPFDESTAHEVIRFMDLSASLELPLHLGHAQIVFYGIAQALENGSAGRIPEVFRELAGRLAVRLNSE